MRLDIAKLKPETDTSADIQAALDRVAEARADANASLTQAAADRQRLLLEGSAREIEQAERVATEARLALERLAILKPKLTEQLNEAREREAREARDAEIAALRAEIEESDQRWNKDLPVLVRKIDDLVKTRQALADRASTLQLFDEASALREGGAWSAPSTAAMREHAKAEQEEKARRDWLERRDAAERRRQEFDRRNEEAAARQREAEESARLRPAVIQRAEDHRGPGLVSSVVR